MYYVNLHDLPPGKEMFTLYIGQQGTPAEQTEEYDLVAPHEHGDRRYLAAKVIETAKAHLETEYGPLTEVRGVVNQSTGQIIFDSRKQGFVALPVDLPKAVTEAFEHPYDALIDLCQDEHDGLGTAEYRDWLLGR